MIIEQIRKHGEIPEKKHDCFLLSLFLALLIHGLIALVYVLLPAILFVLTLVGIVPVEKKNIEDNNRTFVLVDPDSFEELDNKDNIEVEAIVDKNPRQIKKILDLPEGKVYSEEEFAEILSSAIGFPIEESNTQRLNDSNNSNFEIQEEVETQEELKEHYKEELLTEIKDVAKDRVVEDKSEIEEVTGKIKDLDEKTLVSDKDALKQASEEIATQDLAMLEKNEKHKPVLSDREQRLKERRLKRQLEGYVQPEIKKIETPASGTPLRRNTNSTINSLLSDDVAVKALEARWGKYMQDVVKKLEQSVRRQVILNSDFYAKGRVKILFGIAEDGSLSKLEVLYSSDDSLRRVIISRDIIKGAAKFDPLSKEMQEDDNFQKITVNIHFSYD